MNDSEVSQEDYEFGLRVWKAFGIRNMGDYHDLYLIGDVMLLTDLFSSNSGKHAPSTISSIPSGTSLLLDFPGTLF